MSHRKVRVGLVGFGGSGLALYRAFASRNDCEVVAIFDPKQPGIDRATRASNVATVNGLEQLWKAKPDAVAICSPDSSHAGYIVAAVERGVHVLCEKPLTDSLEGIRAIKVATDLRPQIVVAVQHQMRFLDLSQKVKGLFQRKELGAVSYLEGYYVHDLRERAWLNDTWRADDNATPLVYCGCHFVDLLRWWIGEEVVEVFAMGNHLSFKDYPESDLNVVLIRFESGAIGKVVVSFGTQRPQDHSIRVFGSRKSIDDSLLFSESGLSVIARPRLELTRGGTQRLRRLFANFRALALTKTFDWIATRSRLPGDYGFNRAPLRLYEHSLAVERSVDDFLKALVTGGQPLCTVDEASRCVEVCLAGLESMRTGRPVQMSEFLRRGEG